MIDYDSLEEFRDPQTYDLIDNGYEDDLPLTEQWAGSLGGQLVITEQQYYDPIMQIQHCTNHLTFLRPEGQRVEKTHRTALRYVFPQEMEALLFYNGLQIRSCYGNWQQGPLTATSPAMIYVCQRRV